VRNKHWLRFVDAGPLIITAGTSVKGKHRIQSALLVRTEDIRHLKPILLERLVPI
jgi:hypothetical protein